MRRVKITTMLLFGLVPTTALAADPAGSGTGAVPSVTVRHAYVDAFIRTQPDSIVDAEPIVPALPEDSSPLLNRLEVAGPWLKLMGAADAERQWEQSECGPRSPLETTPRLCGLRWRKNNAFSDLSTSLDEFSHGMKSRVVGKGLADHLEVDVDSSPEIRLKWEFE